MTRWQALPCDRPTAGLNTSSLLRLHDPDVAVIDRVAVILELDRAGGVFFLLAAGGRAAQLQVVVDGDAVVDDVGNGVGGLATVLIEASRLELDIVRLPGERRIAHVD